MQQEKPKTVLGRLDTHEKQIEELDKTMTSVFTQFQNQVRSQLELLEGMLEALKETDPEMDKKVSAKIEAKRLARLQERADQEKAQIESLVTSGVLRVTDKAKAGTVLVGRIFQPDGTVFGAGRNQVEYDRLNEETKLALVDKEVGFVHESEDKSKFEVLEIYEVVPQEAPKTAAPALAVVPETPAPVVEPVVTSTEAAPS